MEPGALLFLTLFGGACVLFGLWLRPKWRRARQARLVDGDGLVFSGKRARERWLWMNTFGSIAIGGVILGVALLQILERMDQRARAAELRRISIGCTVDKLIIESNSSEPVRIDNAELLEWNGLLGEAPYRWKARLASHEIPPRGRVEIPYQTTPGVCERPRFTITLVAEPQRRACELQVDVSVRDWKHRVGCQIK
jgi:hypothetical protein